MKRSSISLVIFGLIGFSLSLDALTVYSFRHYPADDALFEKFTEQTGIPVEVVKAKAGALLERLEAEGDQSPADILITSDAARLHIATEKGLLQPIDSPILKERIPPYLRDPNDNWFGFTQRARVFVYNPESVSSKDLTTYEDLANPEWRGRIVCRSSSNVYNQSLLASVIAADGKDAAINWAKGVRKNMARAPQGNDRDQIRAVAKGLADLAIVNTYYVGLMLNSDDHKDRKIAQRLKIFFPNQANRGTHINISGAGITKASKNIEDAKAFLEFLASDEAQSTFPNATYEYPVVNEVEWSEQQKEWGQFKSDTLSLDLLGENNANAIRVFNLAGWE
ncbi:MAG: Fe(3+) ABC transporter substrate-binding protein [Verrucomicrobiota bacterium]